METELKNWHYLMKYLSETTYDLQPSFHGIKGGWSIDVCNGGYNVIVGGYGLEIPEALQDLVDNIEKNQKK